MKIHQYKMVNWGKNVARHCDSAEVSLVICNQAAQSGGGCRLDL